MFIHNPPVALSDLQSETHDDGQRYYLTPDGTKLPSVTTVLSAKKKKSIQEWRNRVGHEEANRISGKASRRGTQIHSIAENYINNSSDYLKDVMPDNLETFLSIKPYIDKINTVWYQEQALYGYKLGMAGRCDLIGEYEGVPSVIDFKTSTKVKQKSYITDYFTQCTAYSLMLREMTNIQINQIVIIMAVDDHAPLIFVEQPRNYIDALVDSIEFYRNSIKFN